MDKALEKINKLKEKLEELYIEKDNIEDKIDFNKEKRKKLSIEKYKLVRNKIILKNQKNNIEYNQANLKKWKIQKIICTTIIILILELLLLGCTFPWLDSKLSLTISSFFSVIAIPIGIWGGDMHYSSAKKYLNEHNLSDVEKKLDENNKELKLSNERIDKLNIESNDLLNRLEKIFKNINLLKTKIEDIEKLRLNVIDEFTKNNFELDKLINNKYEKEKQKILNKKRESM